MKIRKACYIDDGMVILGLLLESFPRKPIFYATDPLCGWDFKVINKAEQSKVVIFSNTIFGKWYYAGCKVQDPKTNYIVKTLRDCVNMHCYSRSILEQSLALITYEINEIARLEAMVQELTDKCARNDSANKKG